MYARKMHIVPKYKSPASVLKSLLTLGSWHAIRTHALFQLGWEESRVTKRSVSWGNYLPWLPYSCTFFLQQTVAKNASVLELGGGGSTLWWLSRGNKVVTLETEKEWAIELSELVKSKGLQANWQLVEVERLEAGHISEALGGNKFDVVVNDGHGSRSDFIDELELCVSSNGIIIWDNSDRETYSESISNLKKRGWQELEFFDISPINAYCSKTTLFLKNSIEIMGSKINIKTIEY
jgi:hypothetical protein